jgi:hypothetical protein
MRRRRRHDARQDGRAGTGAQESRLARVGNVVESRVDERLVLTGMLATDDRHYERGVEIPARRGPARGVVTVFARASCEDAAVLPSRTHLAARPDS